jgi:hypothetical protein
MKTTTRALVSEMATLRAAVAAHRALIVAAQVVRDEAIEFCNIPTQYGRYTVDLKKEGWRYPSIAAATEIVEKLADDNGYYWACSRLMDLERLLGVSVSQLPLRTETNYVPLLRGHIPAADPSVALFLAA